MKTWQKVVGLIAILGILGIAVIVGGGYYFIKYIEKRADKASLTILDLSNDSKESLTVLTPIKGRGIFSPNDENILTTIVRNETNYLIVYNLTTNSGDTIIESSEHIAAIGWSPDGNTVFYSTNKDNQRDIWKIYLETMYKERLTNDLAFEKDIKLSPDGQHLLFTHIGSTNHEELFMLNTQGGEKIELTQSTNIMKYPQTPFWIDNNHVAYISFLTLTVMNTKTGGISNTINLAGLNNFSDGFRNPLNSDKVYIKARNASGGFSYNLYEISLPDGSFIEWRKGFSMFSQDISMSNSGDKLLYTAM